MADSAKVIVEVMAGVLPGDPEQEYVRRWFIGSEEWERLGVRQPEKLAELNGKAQGYAMWLMLQPDRLNWVRTEWLWV